MKSTALSGIRAITSMQLPRTKRGHTKLLLYRGHRRAPCGARSPPPGLFTASGNGSGRPWNTAAVVSSDGRAMPRKRLEGRSSEGRQAGVHRHRRQPGAVKRPSRPLDAGHRPQAGLCRAASAGAVKEEHGDILYRKRNGRLPARLRHTSSAIMRHIVDYPRRSGDFRQLIVIRRGRPFQFPHSTSTSSPRFIQLPAVSASDMRSGARKRLVTGTRPRHGSMEPG